VYLFRDAAYNMLAGHGFTTASFERSTSFSPVLYSSYTPATLWVFAGVAKILGGGALVARIYPFLLALGADVVVLFAGLRFAARGWQRRVLIALVGVVLPFSFLGPLGDRPEPVSFLVLVALVLVMRREPGAVSAAVAGLLGGAAFLCEPFAGVLAVLLIGGWLGFAGVEGTRRIGFLSFARQAMIAAIVFSLPVAIAAGAFYHRDTQSLRRFWQQATVAGVGRQANYSMGDAGARDATSPNSNSESASQKPGSLQKYIDALKFHRVLGPIHLVEVSGCALAALVWVLLLPASKGPWRGRCALALAGLACFVFPALVFPLQGNYLSLTRLLFPILLAANWASVRSSLRSDRVIALLLIVNGIAILPASGISVLMGWEGRTSYTLATRQVEILREYLAGHPLNGKVVLVPATNYYLYKNAVGDIYNPAYLSSREDRAQIGAVVNCYAGLQNFNPGTLPLPDYVADGKWKRLSTAQDAVEVSLLWHKLMSRNWGMGCDIYVAPSD
jgi:hypothetical protein